MSDSTREHVPISATTRRSRRVSAIWLIPLIAVAIGAWLAWDTLSKEGPTITISFETAEGLQAGQSQLKFRDIQLGTVHSLALSADHAHVLVTVATTRQAEPLLTSDTQFWVVKPRLFAGNVSGLSTLVSGSVYRHASRQGRRHVQTRLCRARRSARFWCRMSRVIRICCKAGQLGSVTLGSPVFFRDISVGEVLGWDLGDMAESATDPRLCPRTL